jgi:hypothetical protein
MAFHMDGGITLYAPWLATGGIGDQQRTRGGSDVTASDRSDHATIDMQGHANGRTRIAYSMVASQRQHFRWPVPAGQCHPVLAIRFTVAEVRMASSFSALRSRAVDGR